jgi:hypothetical protein
MPVLMMPNCVPAQNFPSRAAPGFSLSTSTQHQLSSPQGSTLR